MKASGKQGEIDRAQMKQPKEGVRTRVSVGSVGQERKAGIKAVQEGGSLAETAGNPLRGAMRELKVQHPHDYDDHGPHHGTTSHIRHEPHPYGGKR